MTKPVNVSARSQTIKAVPPASLTLDDLADMTGAELAYLYSQGSVPRHFDEIGSRPKGRMLAVRHLDNRYTGPVVRHLAKLATFPWVGMRIASTGAQTGDGINRVRMLLNTNWFEFTAGVHSSDLDGAPAIHLVYGPANPWFIRMIRDEIREIEPGLFLGTLMVQTRRDRFSHALWFALDSR
jgi:hypothetical protein